MSRILTPRRELILPSRFRQKQGGFIINPFAAGGTSTYTTLDPAFVGAGVTLSASKLDISTSGSTGTAMRSSRCLDFKTGGKWYFEVKVISSVATADKWIGFCTTAHTNSSADVVGSAVCAGHMSSGHATQSGAASYSPGWDTAGDVVMAAIDLDTGKIYFGVNGTWLASSNPATGYAPRFNSASYMSFGYAMVGARGISPYGGVIRANFGTTPFAYTPPSGFSGWTTN